ncbi:MAG: hypothetical protein ACOX3L_06030 [Lutisporaceae bacterium]
MKKILRTAAIILMLALVLGQLFQPGVQADTDDAIIINMKVGFDKFYKIGYTTPVYFEIENKLRDINGEIQLEMPSQYDSITLYAMNVSLPKDSVKKFLMNVPVNVFNTKIKVNIAEKDNIISTKSFRIDPGSSTDTFAIGILSDDFDSIKYINKVSMKNLGNIGTKNVRLDENSFPEDIDALKTFNAIVINNYDTSRLGTAQYDTLKKWVAEGGILIIGTGPSHNKSLAVFKDDFITGEIGEVSTLATSSLNEMAGSKAGSSMKISVLDITIKNSTPVMKDGESVLLQKVEKGKGVVGIASFDFGMEPLSAWVGNSAFADKTIVTIMPQYYFSDIYQKDMMMWDNLYSIDNALRNIPELPMPKTSHMVFLYIVYVLLAAPISYLVLKRMDKREMMWVIVPALSIAFSGVVYITGAGTRLTEPVTNVISLVDIDNSGTISPKVYAGVFTPNKDNIRIEAARDFKIKPLRMNNNYYRGSIDSTSKRTDSKITLSPKTVLEFYNRGVWSMNTLVVEAGEEFSGKLESNLNYAKDSFTGTIFNNSGFDLDECYIITPNQYADIGPIKNGETKHVNVKPSSYFGQRYELINAIYKDPYSGPNRIKRNTRLTPEQMAEFRRNLQKRQVLEYGLMNEAYQSYEAQLIAWSSTPVAKDLLVNGRETRKYEKAFITSKANLSFRDGNSVEYPLGFLRPTIVNNMNAGNYDDYGKMFYGKGSFEVHYTIEDMKLENIKIQYTVGDTQRVRQYLWDNEKKDWVEGDYRSYYIHDELIKKYVDNSNMLKIKIEMDDDKVQLPQIAVKGSVK